jgi:hypothetical protein
VVNVVTVGWVVVLGLEELHCAWIVAHPYEQDVDVVTTGIALVYLVLDKRLNGRRVIRDSVSEHDVEEVLDVVELLQGRLESLVHGRRTSRSVPSHVGEENVGVVHLKTDNVMVEEVDRQLAVLVELDELGGHALEDLDQVVEVSPLAMAQETVTTNAIGVYITFLHRARDVYQKDELKVVEVSLLRVEAALQCLGESGSVHLTAQIHPNTVAIGCCLMGDCSVHLGDITSPTWNAEDNMEEADMTANCCWVRPHLRLLFVHRTLETWRPVENSA